MDIEILSEESLLTFYENIRQQVRADIRLGASALSNLRPRRA